MFILQESQQSTYARNHDDVAKFSSPKCLQDLGNSPRCKNVNGGNISSMKTLCSAVVCYSKLTSELALDSLLLSTATDDATFKLTRNFY